MTVRLTRRALLEGAGALALASCSSGVKAPPNDSVDDADDDVQGDGDVLPDNEPAPTPTGFGSGSDAGTFADHLWTPGRDEQGRVNGVSWQLVPVGEWVNVAGTRLDALDSVVKAAIPGWQDYGSGRWVAVTNAWNGIAIDDVGCRAWWVCAGGHADSSNNGIYRFDGYKMMYSVELLPSDTTQWSDQYKNLTPPQRATFTPCYESDQRYQEAVSGGTASPINDWFSDELYWDRRPTSRHVYSGVVYLRETNELVIAVRRLWRYDIASKTWTYKRQPSDSASANLGEENIVHFDQSHNQLQIVACGSGGPFGDTFDLTTQAWTGQEPPGTGWVWNCAADYRYGDVVTLFKPPEDPSVSNGSSGPYVAYDVTTRATIATGNVQFAGGLTAGTFATSVDGSGMVYVPPLNRYWCVLQLAAGGVAWCELDPTTTPWTLRPLSQAGFVPALSADSTLTRRRMMWSPDMKAVIWLGSADKDISLYRVA